MKRLVVATVSAGMLTVLAACSSATATDANVATPAPSAPMTESTMESMKPEKSAQAATPPGAFISQADYESNAAKYDDGDVVLFFNASWCPTCQEAQGNLTSQPIPDGVTIVDVDYDSNTDLRQEYGVTTQHTFVQIDSNGQPLTKFTGASTADEITAQLS